MCGWCTLNKETHSNKSVWWERKDSLGDSARLIFTDKDLRVIVEKDGVEEFVGSVMINFCPICERELRETLYRVE